jgi:hypothetical protein
MDTCKDVPNAILTTAESFPSGEAIELLADGRLLLYTPEGEPVIGSSVSWANQRYAPVPLDPSLQQVLRFPDHIEAFGTTEELMRDLSEHLGGNGDACFLLTSYILSTHVADQLLTTPLLNLWGAPGTENHLVSILSCLCRRALPIALPAVGELFSLPRHLDPTLILRVKRDRDLAPLLAATAQYGAGSLKNGRLHQLRSPMIVCTSAPIGVPALSLSLAPTASCRPISRETADQLANRYLPRLLDFRLRCRQQVAASGFQVPDFTREMNMVAMTLGSVFEGQSERQACLVSALRKADEGWKTLHAQSDAAVVLEALLVACHEDRQKIYVAKVTEMANLLLMARQAKKELSPEGVGRMLSDLGLVAKRDGPGSALGLDRYNRVLIHLLARAHYTLSSLQPRTGCSQCYPTPRPIPPPPPDTSTVRQEPENLHDLHNLHKDPEATALALTGDTAHATDTAAGGAV